MGLRGAVEPELVMEVELSSCSWWWLRLLRMDAGRGRDDLFSGLREPPSCYTHTHTHTHTRIEGNS